MKTLVTAALRAPAWTWGIVLAALASVPALRVEFVGDDFIQRAMLDGRLSEPTSWLGLYEFTPPGSPMRDLIEQGSWPWFTDPEIEIRFFRPIASASLAFDVWAFGSSAALAHAHSLLWLLLLTAVSASLYQRWFAPAAARLSAAVFALAGVHAQTTAWLAAARRDRADRSRARAHGHVNDGFLRVRAQDVLTVIALRGNMPSPWTA